ncbi:hypothetical protein N8T08_010767 [Aspergillus melleus]|uniref:Uncharacterized protein n=1 Tax=Aspergillus melleus TaxID=138277 RepID=A0ACC3BC28_9EURO|nr:hypothetical protein N8T08_010767 [Aspergillus melleus]
MSNETTTSRHGSNGLLKEVFVDGDVAISPNVPAEVPSLLKQIGASGDLYLALQDEKVRTDLLDTARSLVHALETPREAIIRHCWSQRTDYRNPDNGTDAPFQLGFKTNLHFFDFLRANPNHAVQFNNHMSAYHQGRPSWMDPGFYPVPTLTEGLNINKDDVLLVDVGGGTGHDISEFWGKWPQISGRAVLQDLPEVIRQANSMNLPSSIETMSHDFFTQQPIKGARAYYMHSVLHDWNDDNCRKILSNIVPAMARGYSKVLINENVIPSTNAYWEATSLDIIMMANFASTERTEKHWRALVESAGLKVIKIWTVRRGVESLIECELP